jgi:hypothetical protein
MKQLLANVMPALVDGVVGSDHGGGMTCILPLSDATRDIFRPTAGTGLIRSGNIRGADAAGHEAVILVAG